MGSESIAGMVAQLAFWLLLGAGVAFGELGVRSLGVFVGLWVTGLFGLPYIQPVELFTSYVAVLDIALVFLVFKGDVHLSGR